MNWELEFLFILTSVYYFFEAKIHFIIFHKNKFADKDGSVHKELAIISALTNLGTALPFILKFYNSGFTYPRLLLILLLLAVFFALMRAYFHDGFYNLFRKENFFFTGSDQKYTKWYDFDAVWITLEKNGIEAWKAKTIILLIVVIVYKIVS